MAKKKLSFEEALHQLETIAEQIEQGQIGLEESVAQYEQGMALGEVKRWLFNGAQDVMEVEGEKTRLVPWIPAVVKAVDLENRKIHVDWGADW